MKDFYSIIIVATIVIIVIAISIGFTITIITITITTIIRFNLLIRPKTSFAIIKQKDPSIIITMLAKIHY